MKKILPLLIVLLAGCGQINLTFKSKGVVIAEQENKRQEKTVAQLQDSVRVVSKENHPTEVKYSIYVKKGAKELNGIIGKKRVIKEKPKPVKKIVKPKTNYQKEKEKALKLFQLPKK